MTLADALRAAKALIDTPEKHHLLNAWNALLRVGGEEIAFPAYELLELATPRADRHYRHYEEDATTSHADVMAVFDRAIHAAQATP